MARGDTRRIVQVSGDLSPAKVNEALRQISEQIRQLEGRQGVTNFRSPVRINSDKPTVLKFNPTSGYGPGAIVAYDNPEDQSLWFVRGGERGEDGIWTATAREFSAVALEDDGSVSFYHDLQLEIDKQFTPTRSMNFSPSTFGGPGCIFFGDANNPIPYNTVASLCWQIPGLWTLDASNSLQRNQRIRQYDQDATDWMITGWTSPDFQVFFGGAGPHNYRIGEINNWTRWEFDNQEIYPFPDDAWALGRDSEEWKEIWATPLAAKYRADSLAAWTPPTNALAYAFVWDTTVFETNTAAIDMQTAGGSANTGVQLVAGGYYRCSFDVSVNLANNTGHSIYALRHNSSNVFQEWCLLHTKTNVTGSARLFKYTGSFSFLASAGDYITISTDGATIGAAGDAWNSLSIERLN